jgi:hypothetical protein
MELMNCYLKCTKNLEVRIVTCWGATVNWVYIGEWMEIQAITAPLLISTIHKPPQHSLSLFQPAFP